MLILMFIFWKKTRFTYGYVRAAVDEFPQNLNCTKEDSGVLHDIKKIRARRYTPSFFDIHHQEFPCLNVVFPIANIINIILFCHPISNSNYRSRRIENYTILEAKLFCYSNTNG